MDVVLYTFVFYLILLGNNSDIYFFLKTFYECNL